MGVSYRYNRGYPRTREEVFRACLEAVRQSGFRVRKSDPHGGWIRASARMGFRSWGESIDVSLDREGRVDVTSESLFPFTVADWGKNRDNVYRILDRVGLILSTREA